MFLANDKTCIDCLHAIRIWELDRIIDHLPAPHQIRILEIGGGTGLQAKILTEKGYDITSIDILQSNYAKSRVFPVIDYDGTHIPFPGNSFDIIISSNTLEHIRDIIPFLKETARVLKPNGYCIHIMPTATWRFWTMVTHYPNLVMYALHKMLHKKQPPADVAGQPLQKKSLFRTILRNLLPPRHGETGCVFGELYSFSRFSWIQTFRKGDFEVQHIHPVDLFYTGSMLFGKHLSLSKRQKLAKPLGSACLLYKVSPKRSDKNA